METLPIEFYGVAGGAMVMLLVEALKKAKLVPSDYAGLAAILIAWVVGSAALLVYQELPWPKATLGGLLWGLAIVVIHNGVVKPVAEARQVGLNISTTEEAGQGEIVQEKDQ